MIKCVCQDLKKNMSQFLYCVTVFLKNSNDAESDVLFMSLSKDKALKYYNQLTADKPYKISHKLLIRYILDTEIEEGLYNEECLLDYDFEEKERLLKHINKLTTEIQNIQNIIKTYKQKVAEFENRVKHNLI